MKILLAIDGSKFSKAATQAVIARTQLRGHTYTPGTFPSKAHYLAIERCFGREKWAPLMGCLKSRTSI